MNSMTRIMTGTRRSCPALSRFLPDRFTQALIGTVLLASFLPATGLGAQIAGGASQVALIVLFFLYGARLPLEAVLAGLRRPGLHALILGTTFLLFPVLGVGLHAAFPALLPEPLWLGLLFVCMLSSTVQSSIAFTSIAGGNVAAALCAASFSNLAGVFVTPALVALLMHRSGMTGGLEEMGRIAAQVLLPFAAGSALRPLIGAWAGRHKGLLSIVDRGSILVTVYAAFSAAVAQGIWQRLAPGQVAMLLALDAALLGLVMLATLGAARLLRLPREDEIAVLFCGSKKSLASGVPMAGILFGAQAGLVVVPLMLFHQMQLMACAVIARRYAAREEGRAEARLARA